VVGENAFHGTVMTRFVSDGRWIADVEVEKFSPWVFAFGELEALQI
jgi:hypothetical protein